MLSRIRNSFGTTVFSLILGVYLFNISIDVTDSSRYGITLNREFNEQESIVELIVEKVLGYENAISEGDDTESEDQENTAKSNLKIEYITHCANPAFNSEFTFKPAKKHFTGSVEYLNNGYIQLSTPPPKI